MEFRFNRLFKAEIGTTFVLSDGWK